MTSLFLMFRQPAVQLMLAGMLLGAVPLNVQAENPQHLEQLLNTNKCPRCDLHRASLVLSDLRNADLRGADLRGANLSRARLEEADLRGADLRGAVLVGADLTLTDLRGAQLEGVQLAEVDLRTAKFSPGALDNTDLLRALALTAEQGRFEQFYNGAVAAYQRRDYPRAEELLGMALQRRPNSALGILSRGILNHEQGRVERAEADLKAAETLLASGQAAETVDPEAVKQLKGAIARTLEAREAAKQQAAWDGVMNTVKGVLPLLLQFL